MRGVNAFRSMNLSFALKWSTRDPMGTSTCRLPLFNEIDRAVETSIVGIGTLVCFVSSCSGSATSGIRICSARNGFGRSGLGSEDISFGDSVMFTSSAVNLGGGAVLLSDDLDEDLSFASFAGGNGGSRPVLTIRFGRSRRDLSFVGGLLSVCDALCCC